MFDHIRLFRRVLTTAVLLAATGAAAADRNWTVEGSDLRFATPCAKRVTIEPSSSLSGKIEVTAHADHQEEVDQLAVTGGSTALVARKDDSCWTPGKNIRIGNIHIGASLEPTLELTVKVPQSINIAIKESGSGDYRIGAVDGTLRLDLHGSGSVEAENAKELSFGLTGSGGAHIQQVMGKIEGKISGSGDLDVAKANVASTDVTITGSGSATIHQGDLGAATVYLHGSGQFSGPAAGNVKVESSGSSSFSLHSVNAATVSLHVTGNGDIDLGDGSIGSLVAASHGSADIRIGAAVTDADLSVHGSGDIILHKVTGQLSRSEHGSGKIKIDGR
jgi:hypothetical protein